ncbi:unnamed protein product [Microthlaspi erraticum]|uniref:NB-ARC domain-containing protein n=1 Tax=Microthlaspi erraticum TaxID=1685480 RepID=A0A6D2JTR0_9BRAS|nr:unnamed protein product [Microthlaspi erraticum]
MAETLLAFGVEKLWDLLVRESDRFQGVEEQFDELKSDMNMLRCFLEDADAKKHTSAMVKNTVKEIKEIVYDAEDIIETFLLKEELGKTSGIRNSVKRLAWVIVDRRELASDLRAISKRISKVIRDMKSLGVHQVILNEGYIQSLQERQREMRQTFSNDNESVLVGLEKNIEKLVLGWAVLFTRKYVWQTILKKLRPAYKVSHMTEDELQENLFKVLETQKALIVLDDIWREEEWDRIKPMFPRKKESKVDEEMEEMGRQMIKHCGGLPLAVKVLGGLLAAQYTSREWKRIYENIRSHIVGGTSFNEKNISSVYHVLYMSFEELPVYLKHCFLYLAHFPEDKVINVGDLAYYWDAEGIPRPRHYDGATIREVADGYIEELVKRNMVISERSDSTSRFEICHLHDMMREVCLLKAEEENFIQIADASSFTSPTKSQSPCTSRRLGIHSSDDTIHMEGYSKNPKLRSLIIKKQYRGSKWKASGLCFKGLQLMRVLDITGAEFQEGKLPSSIGKLIHLKYLSLYRARVSHLPSSMRNLKLLLYLNLNVEAGSPLYVPNILKEMQELRYLWLPSEIHDKADLELGDLINLEVLENFSTKHSSVTDLHRMSSLRTISILFNCEYTLQTLTSPLCELSCLENLTISDHEAGTENILYDFIRCVEEDPLPILRRRYCNCRTRMICSSGGFPQLKNLVLEKLDPLEEWIVEEGSMPLLHTLSITHCNNLKELLDGLRFITSLKELTIITTESKFKEKLYRGGEDHYKVQHIPLVKIPVVSMSYTPEERYGWVIRIDNQVNMF